MDGISAIRGEGGAEKQKQERPQSTEERDEVEIIGKTLQNKMEHPSKGPGAKLSTPPVDRILFIPNPQSTNLATNDCWRRRWRKKKEDF